MIDRLSFESRFGCGLDVPFVPIPPDYTILSGEPRLRTFRSAVRGSDVRRSRRRQPDLIEVRDIRVVRTVVRRLIPATRLADILSMLNFAVQELSDHPEWRCVLLAYQSRYAEVKQANPEADGWLPRLLRIDGVDPAQLSRLHGKLIAVGFLKFDISGKAGMHYQVSPLGHQTLERGLESSAEIAGALANGESTADE